MKLQTKIQLFFSVFMLVLILLVNTSIYYSFYQLSVKNELNQLDAQMETIIKTLNDNPQIAQNQLLRAYLPTEGMIRVIDEEERLLISLTKDSDYTSLPISYSASEIQEVTSYDNLASVAVVAQPVIWSDGNVVTLQVAKQLTGLEATMDTLLYVVIGAAILALIPAIIAGRIVSGFVLKPIQSLIQTMKVNKEENTWKKIPVRSHSKDELYQMEQTFNEMIEQLRENYNRQEQFVSDASHELKTPIAIVKSYAQLLERRGIERPEIFLESVGAIETEADRMQQLVEQLLFLAKSRNEQVLNEVNVVNLCIDVSDVFIGAYNRNIVVNRNQEKIVVKGNEEQLKQVIYSLIDNACKYSDDKIVLTITKNERTVTLNVQDFGQGIPEDEHVKIFDRFYRVDKARTRDDGGTGLGLSIAKSIIDAHKGEISAASEINKGSTFTVTLPLISES
ncbi:HAMP domain-containing sensor histidine kinase [Virgibacillus flavescens]|uniref:HAMP domain-containing sensor histidine kinase n=1 Tax=Virgibacillus flavescens TaxID=1611422 RepID=UPI003D34860E